MKTAIFDIDDTIVAETEFMLKYAPRFLMERYSLNPKVVNPFGYGLNEVYNLTECFRQLGYGEDSAAEKSRQISQEFWNRNFVKYCRQPLKPGVKETIEALRCSGYRIIFVSLRGKKSSLHASALEDYMRFRAVMLLTASQLSRGGVQYDLLKLVESKEQKIEFINAMNPDCVFEDQVDVINGISAKAKIFYVSAPHNCGAVLSKNVIRIEKFQAQAIEQITSAPPAPKDSERKSAAGKRVVKEKSIRNPSYLKKIFTEAACLLVSKAGTPIMRCRYHPIVRGKDNIPRSGAVVFAGNHRNKLDPVIIGGTSNRSIHWGALLRMFQGKENLFSPTKNPVPCYLSAAFITMMGAVPIARNTDQNYLKINLESIRALYQILAWGGAVGLFPEGTLNRKPEECNILPLKSDRVFRMASDMDGLIQPFSIVWIPKEIGIKNRVILNYGMPINCEERTGKETYDLWYNAVDKGIEEAKAFIRKIDGINGKDRKKLIEAEIRKFAEEGEDTAFARLS